MSLDRRLHAFRPDLADARLKGQVVADRYVEGVARRVVAASTPLKPAPLPDGSLDSELIRGEEVAVFDTTMEGWAFVQSRFDGYVGYVATEALGPVAPAPTHRVTALRTFVYPGPDMKLPAAAAALSLGSEVAVAGEAETRGTRFALLSGGEGAVFLGHLAPVDAPPEPDFVAVAERFVGVPYLWGGRTSLGLDCSALVQVAMRAAGRAVLRDTDMQRDSIGTAMEGSDLRRGDLVFWPGHVAILVDEDRIVHASGRHMAVVVEPLAEALARIGAPTIVRRPG